jgi:hypothetical protein
MNDFLKVKICLTFVEVAKGLERPSMNQRDEIAQPVKKLFRKQNSRYP